MPGRQCPQSRSMTMVPSRSRDSTPHTSRKCPVNLQPRPAEPMPTHSPVQKTPKLKSVVQRAPTTKCYWDLPYKALQDSPIELVNYLMGTLDCKAYDVEIRCLAIFPMQVSILAHHVIASIMSEEVGANCRVHFMTPLILAELMRLQPQPSEAEVPGLPAQSKDYQRDMRLKCVRERMYLMHLLQYWYDAGTVYHYSGPVQQESKLMLFVFYLVNAMLNPHHLYILLHEIMDHTPWLHYYNKRTKPKDCMAYHETHKHTITVLEQL